MGKKKELVLMPPDQESDLVWFFGDGQCEFERSACGPMLDALYRASGVSKPCAKCNGNGIIGDDLDFTAPGYGDWCDKCKGTGTLPIVSKKSKFPLTAKPKTVSGGGSGSEPNDKALTKYASISRKINRLQETHPRSVQILAAYYGNAGERWCGTPGYSRLFPVLVLTSAGATLIKRYSIKEISKALWDSENAVHDAHEQLGQMHALNQVEPDSGRTKLFNEAFLQAEKLMETATVDWLAA